MWFEIIPGFAVIVASVAAPQGLSFILNYLVVGHLYRRSMDTYEQRLQYLRDRRLTGDPYKLSGLDKLPEGGSDEDGEECVPDSVLENGNGVVTEEESREECTDDVCVCENECEDEQPSREI